AVLAFIVGIYLFRRPLLSLLVLAVLLGIFWIVHGVIELFGAIGDSGMPGRGWVAVSGVLGIAAGAVVLAFPGMTMLILALILGVWRVVYCVMLSCRTCRFSSARRIVRAYPRGMPPA